MAINKKLIYFDLTYENFKTSANGLNNATDKDSNNNWGNIPHRSIVFLKDGIWTHGLFYPGLDAVESTETISGVEEEYARKSYVDTKIAELNTKIGLLEDLLDEVNA